MIKNGKKAKLITTLTLFLLALLCTINVTISYFTATATSSGGLVFGNLDVRFTVNCKEGNATNTYPSNLDNYSQDNLYTIDIYPLTGFIPRGQSFEFSYGSQKLTVSDLSIRNMSGSCESLVRFWIDAYIKEGETLGSKNYGKHFTFDDIDSKIIARGGTGDYISDDAQKCYFIKYILDNTAPVNLGNSLQISDDLPDEVLGKQLQITISLEAIQYENKAYSKVSGFNDQKGYYSGWAGLYD